MARPRKFNERDDREILRLNEEENIPLKKIAEHYVASIATLSRSVQRAKSKQDKKGRKDV